MEVGVPGDKTEGSTAVESSSVASYLVPTRILNLYVLPAGLSQQTLQSCWVLHALRRSQAVENYGRCHSPGLAAVLSVVDPMVIAGRADGVILVAEAGRTQIAALSRNPDPGARVGQVARSCFNKQSERSPIIYIHHL